MPKNGSTDSTPKSGSAAVRLFLKANPKATGPEVVTGVKNAYGLEVSANTVYNVRGKMKSDKTAKKSVKKVAKKHAAATAQASDDMTFSRTALLQAKALINTMGGVSNVRAALTMIEEIDEV
jgi:hypothetical protein